MEEPTEKDENRVSEKIKQSGIEVILTMLSGAPMMIAQLLTTVMLQYGAVAAALLPALVYCSINLVEAQFITPLIMGRNMRLNPLIIIVWLVLWGWLWGAMGVLLAMPLLVCLKLAVGQSKSLRHWVHAFESRESDEIISGNHD